MKKKTSSKKPVVKKTVAKKAASKKIANFEPVKVSFAVACLAAISILWLAIIAVTTK